MKVFRAMIFVLLAVLLAACAPSTPEAAVQPEPTLPGVTPEAPTSTPSLAGADPTAAPAPSAPAAQPSPRGDALVATDPGEVVLGSGQPVLVEFFAFW